MSAVDSIENVIEVASRLKDGVAALYEAYGLMPPIIDKEHKAIRASDYLAVTAACQEKEVAGDRIETAFSALMRCGDDLGRLRSALTGRSPQRPVTLKECVEALHATCAALPEDAFGTQVLRHLLSGLDQQVKDFEERFRQVKPIIEANRALVTGMLHNLQESYRFWQEVSEQIAISYNKKGTQQAAGRNSGFKAKA